MEECFICCDTQSSPLARVCACQTHIHKDCFERLVSHFKSATCPTCTQPYRPIVKRQAVLSRGGEWFVLSMTFALLFNFTLCLARHDMVQCNRKPVCSSLWHMQLAIETMELARSGASVGAGVAYVLCRGALFKDQVIVEGF
jgi:hypothetical protein